MNGMPGWDSLVDKAATVLEAARAQGFLLTTVESCTGGLIAGALTSVAGSSDVVDRGFVTYSNAAKQQMVSVTADSLARFGAVSSAVAKEMAFGGLSHSMADLAVSVTGVAGPGGGTADKPVGLVWFGLALAGEAPEAFEHRFGDIGREAVRLKTVDVALDALLSRLER